LSQEEILDLKFDLLDPNLLDKIADSFNEKIIGETNNKKILFLACMSKDLPQENRISAMISSSSSAGKSNITNRILDAFSDDVIEYTQFTDSFYMRKLGNTSLDGKIIKIEQMEKENKEGQADMFRLKHQLSEGKTKTGLSERNEEGKWEAKDMIVDGYPVFISTTTNPEIQIETINRLFLIELDESKEQTARITKQVLSQYSTLKKQNTWGIQINEIKKLTAIYKKRAREIKSVIIPYGPKLEKLFQNANMELRRDLKKILNLTCVIAFSHFARRKALAEVVTVPKDSFEVQKEYHYHLIADVEDFEEAIKIGKDVIRQTMNKVNSTTIQIIEIVKQLDKLSDGNGCEISQISNEMGYSQNRMRELMKQGIEAGLVLTKRNEHNKYSYFPSAKPIQTVLDNSVEFTDSEFDEWLESITSEQGHKYELKEPKTFTHTPS
jgi:DNA-binding MarR family transcriptional regulator